MLTSAPNWTPKTEIGGQVDSHGSFFKVYTIIFFILFIGMFMCMCCCKVIFCCYYANMIRKGPIVG